MSRSWLSIQPKSNTIDLRNKMQRLLVAVKRVPPTNLSLTEGSARKESFPQLRRLHSSLFRAMPARSNDTLLGTSNEEVDEMTRRLSSLTGTLRILEQSRSQAADRETATDPQLAVPDRSSETQGAQYLEYAAMVQRIKQLEQRISVAKEIFEVHMNALEAETERLRRQLEKRRVEAWSEWHHGES